MAERTVAEEISDQIWGAINALPRSCDGSYEEGFGLLNDTSLPRVTRTAVALGLIEPDTHITSLCVVDRSKLVACGDQEDVEMWMGLIYPGFKSEPKIKYRASPFIGIALSDPLTVVRSGIEGLPNNLRIDPTVFSKLNDTAKKLKGDEIGTHTLFKFVADEIAKNSATRGWR